MFLGVIMGLAASASWAAANVFVQRSSRAVGAFRALLWAQVVGGVALAPVALAFDQRPGALDSGVVGWAVVAGMSAVLAYVCLFVGTQRGRLSIVIPIMSSWSVIAAALSIGVLGETVRRPQLLGAALVVVGVVIVSRFSLPADGDNKSERGTILFAIGTALGFGVLIPAIERLTPVTGRLGAIPIVFMMDLLIGLPLALAARIDLRPPPRSAWPAVAAAGLFETLGFVWISIGVSHAPIVVVAPLSGVSSAFTVLFAWVFLRERPSVPVLAGAAFVCAGVVALAL
jgi:drug/metabolite transporter (DMT)-like permease